MEEEEPLHRLRLHYRKTGILRFLSHLEISRLFERTVRRARLPIAFTSGFHPHAKMAFGTVLPVGWSGEDEYLDLWLEEMPDPDSAAKALGDLLPRGVDLVRAKYIPLDAPALMSLPSVAEYRVRLASGSPAGIEEAVRRALEQEVEIERKGKRRQYAVSDHLVAARAEEDGIGLSVRLHPSGGPRLQEMLETLRRELCADWEILEIKRTKISVEVDGRTVDPLDF